MRRYPIMLLFICLILAFGHLHAVPADPLKNLKVQPEVLRIDTFYSGGRVTISGQVPDKEQSTTFRVEEIGFIRMIDHLTTHQRLIL